MKPLRRTALVFGASAAVLVGAGSAPAVASENPSPFLASGSSSQVASPCEPEAVKDLAEWLTTNAAELLKEGLGPYVDVILGIVKTYECAEYLGVFDRPNYGEPSPPPVPTQPPTSPPASEQDVWPGCTPEAPHCYG